MMQRILLAVDDSAASLAAARVAVEIAAATRATIHVLHVLADREFAEALRAAACTGVPRPAAAESLVAQMARMASIAGVPVHTEHAAGEPAQCVLDHARSWPADLVVIGRGNHHTQRILEFAEWPVLTVPPPGRVQEAR